MGKRINLAALAVTDVLDGPIPLVISAPEAMNVPIHRVAANPLNPRQEFGDLSDLASMRQMGQLQSCAVVRRAAFLRIFPEHSATVLDVDFVVVAGSRRRAAAERFGLPTLSVTALDQLADSRAQFYAASVAENIDRKNLDVLDEARAVQRLVQEAGSGKAAGDVLGKTKGWVSQRLSLLKLSEPMVDLVKAGQLPVRVARRLAALAPEEQLTAWEQEQADGQQARFTAVNQESARESAAGKPFQLSAQMSITALADTLVTRLTAAQVQQLGRELLRRKEIADQ